MVSNWQAWAILFLAVLFEVVGTSCLNASQGLTRPGLVVAMIISYTAAFAGLALALQSIDMSVAYAVWAGLGIACITVIGALAFNETMTAARVFFLALILIGVVGLNLLSA